MTDSTVWIGHTHDTPLGQVWVAADGVGLMCVAWNCDEAAFIARVRPMAGGRSVQFDAARTTPYVEAIAGYLAGSVRAFDLPINWDVLDDFARRALTLVARIPYGQTRTYGDIAVELGQPGAARAVGRANAANPMPLVIPCHRVLDSEGGLHGYAYGLATKAWLLALEGRPIGRQLSLW